jgi:ABC-2 type transport system permease protein
VTIDALRSEWLKLRSTRSTYYLLGVSVALVFLAALTAWAWGHSWDGRSPARRATPPDGSVEQTLLPVVQLVVAVLGVLAVTSEYTTGMIRTSLTVLPHRRTMLAAKAAIVAASSLVIGLVVPLAGYLLSKPILGDRPFLAYHAPFSERLPGLLSLALSVTVVALVAFGLGAALRSTAGAITVMVALLWVLQMIAGFLPAPWGDRFASILLPNLADQLAGVELGFSAAHGVLSPLGALVAMAAYVTIALGAAFALLARRDV